MPNTSQVKAISPAPLSRRVVLDVPTAPGSSLTSPEHARSPWSARESLQRRRSSASRGQRGAPPAAGRRWVADSVILQFSFMKTQQHASVAVSSALSPAPSGLLALKNLWISSPLALCDALPTQMVLLARVPLSQRPRPCPHAPRAMSSFSLSCHRRSARFWSPGSGDEGGRASPSRSVTADLSYYISV